MPRSKGFTVPNNAIYVLLTDLAILVLFSITCYFQFSIKWPTNVEALLDSKSASFSRVFESLFWKREKENLASNLFFFLHYVNAVGKKQILRIRET